MLEYPLFEVKLVELEVTVTSISYIKPERVNGDLPLCELLVPLINHWSGNDLLPLAIVVAEGEYRRKRGKPSDLNKGLLNFTGPFLRGKEKELELS